VWRVKDEPGKEPKDWKVTHYSTIGTAEPFVHQLINEMPRIVDFGQIMEPQHAAVKEAIGIVAIEGLMPALNSLQKIRSAQADLPEMDRRQLFDEFGRTLWVAYKGLFPLAVERIGFNIGFLFQNDGNFRKCLDQFQAAHPEPQVPRVFGDYLRQQREGWQNTFSSWRNDCLEHPGLAGCEGFASMYNPAQAEALFEAAWNTIVVTLAVLLQAKMWPGWRLVEIPVATRNSVVPDRFRFERIPASA